MAPEVHNRTFKADAHARYARLRAEGPIHRITRPDGLDTWIVVAADLARDALTHPDLGKDPAVAAETLKAAGNHILFAGTGLGGNMLMADPPDHTRLRKLATAAFTHRRTQELAPAIEETARTLLAALPAEGETDLVESYTGPLPMTVISDLLGVPEAARADFRRWSRLATGATSAAQRESMLLLNEFLAELLRDKRRSPGPDLLSALIAVHDEDDGRLSDAELLGTAVLLVTAGHETTVNLLGNAVVALLENPDQLDLLRAKPELLPGAVEEILRYDTSVELTPTRFATRDVELGGVRIPRGSAVMVALGSANRDMPLPDGRDPATFDVRGPAVRHLAFGHGIHHCLGAPLARLEGRIALGALLETLDLAWADTTAPLAWIPGGIMRGPLSLPVRFTRRG
ncbi:Cytochrome P450 [Lentzea xinjiangensis]|uniref:Cytochrome P450 n=1 Tax=Lentzea xinjiangensis TaxID=402600 RepID=A0A1H9W8L1_9PSEU|nr:cytochrome P450 [Lentzea xinjiangensis]SES30296.1 Cytochrome P450 [Lentzea xinjiangensis]